MLLYYNRFDLKMLKILLINAIDYTQEVQTRYPSLGLGYLAACLLKAFNQRVILKIIDRDIVNQINAFRPDVVGISSVSQNYKIAQSYARLAKKAGAIAVIGGCHISILPATLSRQMDIGVLFDGEQTMVELINLLMSTKKLTSSELHKIKGIIYWHHGKIIQTAPRPLLKDLDKLPFPERNLLSIGKHTYVFTSRGCPYRCVFCASSRFWQSVRFFSAEYVVAEIKHILDRYPHVTLISFYDDLFILDYQRLEKLVKLIRKDKLDQKVKFSCSCRANLVNEKVVRLLGKMGVVSVGLGLESGNPRVLNYLKGSSVTLKDNYRAIQLLKKYGIATNGSFIIGAPDETEKEMMDTYNFIKRSKLDFFDIYVLTPLPGTPIWEEAETKGLVKEDSGWDWSKININFEQNQQKAIILAQRVNRRELIKIYRRFKLLQLFLRIKNVWFHPFLLERPFNLIKEAIFKRVLK